MINSIPKKQIITIFALLFFLLLPISCGLLPSGPELTTKYLIFTFVVETDSCQYSSAYDKGNGIIKPDESPFELKLQTTSDDLGDLVVTNFSDASNVYVNFKKTEEEKHFEKDYVIKPNKQVLINMNQ